MIGDYFTKALQGSQCCNFCTIIISIREYDIKTYNASRIALLEYKNIKIKRRKKRPIMLDIQLRIPYIQDSRFHQENIKNRFLE